MLLWWDLETSQQQSRIELDVLKDSFCVMAVKLLFPCITVNSWPGWHLSPVPLSGALAATSLVNDLVLHDFAHLTSRLFWSLVWHCMILPTGRSFFGLAIRRKECHGWPGSLLAEAS